MVQQYSGKERVMAACKGEYTDRVPINIMVPMAHQLAGLTAEECVFDPEKALQAQIKSHEMFPSDMVGVPGNPYLPTTSAATYERVWKCVTRLNRPSRIPGSMPLWRLPGQ